ncbi:MAG: hypothetical protein IPK58_00120 [Acidobacteria bacterium]|nr:hypothetical protein [Acidobacteriota bacterium]
MFWTNTNKNSISASFIFVIILGLVLGCGGGSGKTCVGELTFEGKTFQGTANEASTDYKGEDRVEAQARDNACSSYCIEGDKGYDRMYQEFIKTPEAKKINIDFNAEKITLKEKKWAAMTNEKLSRYIDQCRKGCLKQHSDGTQVIAVKCQ